MKWIRIKGQDVSVWHRWFAWYPVATQLKGVGCSSGGYTETVVWLERVDRRRSDDSPFWEYRV